MVKYHTDEEITMRCLDHRSYPMAVVQEMLRVDPRRSIINGIKNVTPDGIQPPKQISFLSSALEYSNPALAPGVYGNAQVSAIKKKMDSQLIMENLQVRGAMIPPGRGMKGWGRSKLQEEQYRRTKMLEQKIKLDEAEHRLFDAEERIREQNRLRVAQQEMEEPQIVISGKDFENPGEKGFTFNMGLSGTTAISKPTLFEPTKEKRQRPIKLKIRESAKYAGITVPAAEEKPKPRPAGRAKIGTVWDSNRGDWVADPNFKGINWFEKEENKMMREEDYMSKTDQQKRRMEDLEESNKAFDKIAKARAAAAATPAAEA